MFSDMFPVCQLWNHLRFFFDRKKYSRFLLWFVKITHFVTTNLGPDPQQKKPHVQRRIAHCLKFSTRVLREGHKLTLRNRPKNWNLTTFFLRKSRIACKLVVSLTWRKGKIFRKRGNVKVSNCKIWRCEDVKVWHLNLWGCEDMKMWMYERVTWCDGTKKWINIWVTVNFF